MKKPLAKFALTSLPVRQQAQGALEAAPSRFLFLEFSKLRVAKLSTHAQFPLNAYLEADRHLAARVQAETDLLPGLAAVPAT